MSTTSSTFLSSHDDNPFSRRENPVLEVIQEFQRRYLLAHPPRVKGQRPPKVDYSVLYKTDEKNRKWFKQAFEKALKRRPEIRPRTSGRVGPELDWSIVYSDLDRFKVRSLIHRENEVRSSFNKPDHDHVIPWFSTEILAPQTAKHNCLATFHLSKREEVVQWTKWAHRNGVCFEGKRNYSYPNFNISSVERLRKDFLVDKVAGDIPSHNRSPFARARRAARRALSLSAKTRYRISLEIQSPTNREIVENWRTRVGVPFQTVKSEMKNKTVLRLRFSPKKRCICLSRPAKDALNRIYSSEPIPLAPKPVKQDSNLFEKDRNFFLDKPPPLTAERPKVVVKNNEDPTSPYYMWTTGSYTQKIYERQLS